MEKEIKKIYDLVIGIAVIILFIGCIQQSNELTSYMIRIKSLEFKVQRMEQNGRGY